MRGLELRTTERTPSGTGLHILAFGTNPGKRCRPSVRPNVEIYDSKQYLTVTRCHLEGTPTEVADRQTGKPDALYR